MKKPEAIILKLTLNVIVFLMAFGFISSLTYAWTPGEIGYIDVDFRFWCQPKSKNITYTKNIKFVSTSTYWTLDYQSVKAAQVENWTSNSCGSINSYYSGVFTFHQHDVDNPAWKAAGLINGFYLDYKISGDLIHCVEPFVWIDGLCDLPPSCDDDAGEQYHVSWDGGFNARPQNVCLSIDTNLSCVSVSSGGVSICTDTNSCSGAYSVTAEECQGVTEEGFIITDDCSNMSSSGFCLDENKDAQVFDDSNNAPLPPNSVCFEHNGQTMCQSQDETYEACMYYDGEQLCFDDEGLAIDPDSPDSPTNGGNGDGDPCNDRVSCTADPSNPDQMTEDEKAEAQDDRLAKDIVDGVGDKIEEQINNDNRLQQESIDSDKTLQQENQEFLEDTFLDEVPEAEMSSTVSSIISNYAIDGVQIDSEDSAFSNIKGWINNPDSIVNIQPENNTMANKVKSVLITDESCQGLSIPLKFASYNRTEYMTITCQDTQLLREIISYLMWVVLIWSSFNKLQYFFLNTAKRS